MFEGCAKNVLKVTFCCVLCSFCRKNALFLLLLLFFSFFRLIFAPATHPKGFADGSLAYTFTN